MPIWLIIVLVVLVFYLGLNLFLISRYSRRVKKARGLVRDLGVKTAAIQERMKDLDL